MFKYNKISVADKMDLAERLHSKKINIDEYVELLGYDNITEDDVAVIIYHKEFKSIIKIREYFKKLGFFDVESYVKNGERNISLYIDNGTDDRYTMSSFVVTLSKFNSYRASTSKWSRNAVRDNKGITTIYLTVGDLMLREYRYRNQNYTTLYDYRYDVIAQREDDDKPYRYRHDKVGNENIATFKNARVTIEMEKEDLKEFEENHQEKLDSIEKEYQDAITRAEERRELLLDRLNSNKERTLNWININEKRIQELLDKKK